MSKIIPGKNKIYTTKSGSQYIEVGDLVRSEEFKRDCQLIREAFPSDVERAIREHSRQRDPESWAKGVAKFICAEDKSSENATKRK